MKKIVKKVIMVSILFGVMLLSLSGATNINAKSKAKTLAGIRQELKDLQAQKANNTSSKNKTKSQISNAQSSVANKRNEISSNQNKISEAQKESANLEKDIEDGKEKLEKLVSAYQLINDDDQYYDYVFNASSYEDLIYRYAVMEQIMDYMNGEIDKWTNKINQNTQLKIDLEKREKQLNTQISSLQDDIENLGDVLDELNDEALDIDKEIVATKELIKYYENLGCKENEDLDECVRVKMAEKFRRPTKKGKVCSNFGYRTSPLTGAANTFHSGTDISLAEGNPIYPVADGTVGYIVRKSDCGGNKVYIFHVVKGKKYTSTYMHMLDIKVTLGQKVTSETIIGHVGGKTTGTRHGGYDRCTTGAHLHLSLSVGGWYTKYSEWKAHLQDARKTIDLPASWSTR